MSADLKTKIEEAEIHLANEKEELKHGRDPHASLCYALDLLGEVMHEVEDMEP